MDNIKIVRRRKSPNYVQRLLLWVKFYGYWYVVGQIEKYFVALRMVLRNETRLYYLYSTGELIKINGFNYIKRVKVDAVEYALIKTVTSTGYSYTKGERF